MMYHLSSHLGQSLAIEQLIRHKTLRRLSSESCRIISSNFRWLSPLRKAIIRLIKHQSKCEDTTKDQICETSLSALRDSCIQVCRSMMGKGASIGITPTALKSLKAPRLVSRSSVFHLLTYFL